MDRSEVQSLFKKTLNILLGYETDGSYPEIYRNIVNFIYENRQELEGSYFDIYRKGNVFQLSATDEFAVRVSIKFDGLEAKIVKN